MVEQQLRPHTSSSQSTILVTRVSRFIRLGWGVISALSVLVCVIYFSGILSSRFISAQKTQERHTWWDIQSVDTMKLSRDLAREKLNDVSYDTVIQDQMRQIANIGATHVGISTPYDKEFYPFLSRWVKYARAEGLHVWFRGNFSGWEEWFGYPRMDRETHKKELEAFILDNRALFEDGDLFSTCPECENGGPGDPRQTGDAVGYRKFLIEEYDIANRSFKSIGKQVQTNLFSMNGDVASLIMDPETTERLGGVITVDHYVKDAKKMSKDIQDYSRKSKGKVILGEFGAPIPDIHGKMSAEEQATWIDEVMTAFATDENIVGVNYWVSSGGSTEIFPVGQEAKPAAEVLSTYFLPKLAQGRVTNELSEPIPNVTITTPYRTVITNQKGEFRVPFIKTNEVATVSGSAVQSKEFVIHDEAGRDIILSYTSESFMFRIKRVLFSIRARLQFR